MKTYRILSFLLILVFASCKPKKDNLPTLNQKEEKFLQMIQAKDSGYITKHKGLEFLLTARLTDTLDSYWSQAKDSDTIGKYYRNALTNNYFICTIDLSKKYSFETHLLIEVKPNGNIVKKERFFHGNYPCCWNNYYDGFNKYGEYFIIKTCRTGSGYCAGYLYLFKEISSQKSQQSIPESYWSSIGVTQNLTSKMELNNDELIMHYKLEKGELNDGLDFKVSQTKVFDVKFVFKNKKWTPTEKNKFNRLDMEL
jgi:hypothetical protein